MAEQEVIKHTKKVFAIWKGKEGGFWHKLKEFLLEVFIIVFAVSLSIWLHGISEHKHQQKEVKEFLADLKTDLTEDLKNLEDEKQRIQNALAFYRFFSGNATQIKDSLEKLKSFSFNIRLTGRVAHSGNYEGFKSSGKIGYIKNKDIKKKILQYFQETVPSLQTADNFYNNQLTKLIDLMDFNFTDFNSIIGIATSAEARRLHRLSSLVAENNIHLYEDAIRQVNEIINSLSK
jgi:hypothetical protein